MKTPIDQTETDYSYSGRAEKHEKLSRPKKNRYLWFFLSWFLLIASGVMGTMLYTNHLKEQVAAQIARQTQQQLSDVQTDYKKQLDQMKADFNADMAKLQSKVDSLSELLAFAKDSANSKTDNSNQLYTQLAEVKKKLDELKKNLDVLK